MDGGLNSSAGSHYNLNDYMDLDLGYQFDPSTLAPEQQMQNEHLFPIFEYGATNTRDLSLGHMPATSVAPQHFSHQQHLSTSSFSSGPSSFRLSNHSTFSQLPTRDSVSSSLSGWSYTSDLSREQNVSQAEHLLTWNSSPYSSFAPSPVEGPTSPAPRKRAAQRRLPVEKDYFKTCVSGSKHTRTCHKDQRYFCTTCRKPFVEKADWKRHEETYQERREKFKCDLCCAIYFLDKDFVTHHVQSHRCDSCSTSVRCSEKHHVQLARQHRLLRTGWGCGFCCHFSNDWIERCNHVADHIEREGKTSADWLHSWVIYSLLHRPKVWDQWTRLPEIKRGHSASSSWNEHSTGRVEGYPESTQVMHLQDSLEYYTPDQDAAALARLAYDKMRERDPQHEMSSPPPVPQKDYRDKPLPFMKDPEPWNTIIESIIADDTMPVGVSYLDPWQEDDLLSNQALRNGDVRYGGGKTRS